MFHRPMLCLLLVSVVGFVHAQNLCPNAGIEEGTGTKPAGWSMEGGASGEWATDQAHSGARSLKITGKTGATISWISPMIPVDPSRQLILSAWAKLDQVSGGNGAYLTLYHTNEKGERIGQSAALGLGGVGDNVATTDWREYVTISLLSPEVKGVRVNVRLYGATGTAWFDDINLQVHAVKALDTVRPLRRGAAAGRGWRGRRGIGRRGRCLRGKAAGGAARARVAGGVPVWRRASLRDATSRVPGGCSPPGGYFNARDRYLLSAPKPMGAYPS